MMRLRLCRRRTCKRQKARLPRQCLRRARCHSWACHGRRRGAHPDVVVHAALLLERGRGVGAGTPPRRAAAPPGAGPPGRRAPPRRWRRPLLQRGGQGGSGRGRGLQAPQRRRCRGPRGHHLQRQLERGKRSRPGELLELCHVTVSGRSHTPAAGCWKMSHSASACLNSGCFCCCSSELVRIRLIQRQSVCSESIRPLKAGLCEQSGQQQPTAGCPWKLSCNTG